MNSRFALEKNLPRDAIKNGTSHEENAICRCASQVIPSSHAPIKGGPEETKKAFQEGKEESKGTRTFHWEGRRKASSYGKAERVIWAVLEGRRRGVEDEICTWKLRASHS